MKRTIPPKEYVVPDGTIRTLASALVSRRALAAGLGQSFGGERDIYNALGYTKAPQYSHYYDRFDRQDIAKRVVDAFPLACWRKKPELSENKDETTALEKAWKELIKKHKIWHYLRRIDVLSGIGRYGVLLLGFDDVSDVKDLAEEVTKAKDITYLRPVTENNVQIKTWDKDPTSSRYGLPLLYSITTNPSGEDIKETLIVHYSRILHIAENPQEGDLYGTPRLKPVLNRLQDLELVSGSSAEMFWRGAFPGFNFSVDKDFDFGEPAQAALETEIDEYVHNLRRYMRTQGVTAESLSQQVSDPAGHADLYLKLISGSTGIPVRILTGSERGELASSQDEGNFNDRVDERRLDYCEPFILRPLIDRLIEVGVLPPAASQEESYTLSWPDIDIPSELEEANISKIRTDSLTLYANSAGADMIVTPEMFLKKFMGFTDEDIEAMTEALGEGESLDDIYDKLKEEKEKKQQEQFEQQSAAQAAAKAAEAKGGAQPGKPSTNQKNKIIRLNHAAHDQKTHGKWAATGASHKKGKGKEGKGGGWVDDKGKALPKEMQARMKAARGHRTDLKDVMVSADPNSRMVAKGTDRKGKTQYMYSVKHVGKNDASKHARVKEFYQGGTAGKVRAMAKKRMNDANLDGRQRDSAAAVYLISKTGLRPGSDKVKGAKTKAYGVTTLQGQHISIKGNTVHLNYTAKKGTTVKESIRSKALATYLRSKNMEPNKNVFNALPTKVTSDFKRFSGGKKFKLYDFRTLTGTTTALKAISKMPTPTTKRGFNAAKNKVASIVSKKLHNTPKIALSDYIDPTVFKAWEAKFI